MSDAFLVRRGGSGGLSPNGAVIHVTAPAGSTISFAKGGVIAKVLGPDKSHVNSADSTLADWYYAVSPGNYGEWTVTAIRQSDQVTESKTVTVSENKQYDLKIIFKLYLFESGTGLASGYTYRVNTNNYGTCTYTVNTSKIYLSNYILTIKPAVDVTNYTQLNWTISAVSGLGATLAMGTKDDAAGGGLGTTSVTKQDSTTGTKSIDISGYSGDFFIKLFGGTVTTTHVWLSR